MSFPLRLALLYGVVSVVWIWLSDHLLAALVSDPERLLLAQSVKGFVFVLLTAPLLFVLLRRYDRAQQQALAHEREREAEFRIALSEAEDAVLLTDTQGIIQWCNPAFASLLGYTVEEMIGMDSTELVMTEDVRAQPIRLEEIRQARGRALVIRRRLKCKDGSLVTVDSRAKRLSNGLLQGVMRDVTAQVEAETALRLTQTRLQAILDYSSALIFVKTLDGLYVVANKAYVAEFGAVVGMTDDQVFTPDVAALLRTRDQALIESRQPDTSTMSFMHGGTRHTALVTKFLLYDAHGEPNAIGGIAVDVSDLQRVEEELRQLNEELEARVGRRTAELAQANSRLLELDKLRTRFIADISHELRNPVTSLTMRLYMMERKGLITDADSLNVLKEQVERLRTLIEGILDISRIDVGRERVAFQMVDFNRVVQRETSALVSAASDSGLTLSVATQSDTPEILGEPAQLALVVSNLVSNAIRYTPAGAVTVETHFDRQAGHVSLMVTDTGIGIEPDDLPHLFERFYRGRTAVSRQIPGTGLGLSIVREVVDLHNGTIDVASQPGAGTRIVVSLPIPATVRASASV